MFNRIVKGWEVYEDSANRLHLIVIGDNNTVLYYNNGYEQIEGDLAATIALLESGENPLEWDDNKVEFLQNPFLSSDQIVAERYENEIHPAYFWDDMSDSAYDEMVNILPIYYWR